MDLTEEHKRLASYRTQHSQWKKWGPYLSERSWGTVREDYSPHGDPWGHFTRDQAPSRAYRWNEEGLAGLSDRNQRICFALSAWNGQDPLLKEHFFGLSGPEGNHGEDVKDYYFYQDNTPTHSYQKMLYKYPQRAFPYTQLIEENLKRNQHELEYELIHTGIFKENRYFDITVEYAKVSEEEIFMRFTVINRGDQRAPCYLLPTIWFRNTWSWGYGEKGAMGDEKGKPSLKEKSPGVIELSHPVEGIYYLSCDENPQLLFTENETNSEKLYGVPNRSPYVKDAFHRYVVEQQREAVNPHQTGTKAAALYKKDLDPQEKWCVRLHFSNKKTNDPCSNCDKWITLRQQEADAFYAALQPSKLSDELKSIQRQAFAGLLWSKQLYYFDLEQWNKGDPLLPLTRTDPRNRDWTHLTSFDILSMPDKWEYPYFCAWDTAFHCIPMLMLDPDFAKRQIELLTREWYLHPNGQLPAYEWNFSDVNPPVLAWSAWRTYKIDGKMHGVFDRNFLKSIFHKLLLNFTWWVNRKDEEGNNIFQGGFLGLDNISVFDRSAPLPTGGHIDQSDGTAWMAFYCTIMMKIAIYLSLEEPLYQDMATKFFEHFLRIARAMTNCGGKGHSLWDREDGFFYDILHLPHDSIQHLKVRSIVGLLPLLAVETLEPQTMEKLTTFSRRVDWFIKKQGHDNVNIACVYHPGVGQRRLLSILSEEKLKSVLRYMLDEQEFLSEYGIRSVSKYHDKHPYTMPINGTTHTVRYLPAESDNRMFGGNSNWRGPIWFPINFLIIEALQKYHYYYGDGLKVEFPTGSNHYLNLADVAKELSKRLIRLFTRNEEGKRPIYGGTELFQSDPQWKDHILFYEYFHGDNGAGLGASHQTGWTALVAKLIQQLGEQL